MFEKMYFPFISFTATVICPTSISWSTLCGQTLLRSLSYNCLWCFQQVKDTILLGHLNQTFGQAVFTIYVSNWGQLGDNRNVNDCKRGIGRWSENCKRLQKYKIRQNELRQEDHNTYIFKKSKGSPLLAPFPWVKGSNC